MITILQQNAPKQAHMLRFHNAERERKRRLIKLHRYLHTAGDWTSTYTEQNGPLLLITLTPFTRACRRGVSDKIQRTREEDTKKESSLGDD